MTHGANIAFKLRLQGRNQPLCATVGTTTTPKRDSIMYPAVITILRSVGGYTGDRFAKKYRWILPARYSIINTIPRTEKQYPEADFCNLFAFFPSLYG